MLIRYLDADDADWADFRRNTAGEITKPIRFSKPYRFDKKLIYYFNLNNKQDKKHPTLLPYFQVFSVCS